MTVCSMDHEVKIVREDEHYIAYVDGRFYCSGDTYYEIAQELHEDGIC